MADTVDTKVVFSGRKRYVVHLTCVSDGTGESGVTKVDISALTGFGFVPTYTVIDLIEANVQGFTSARLYWDHTTDDEIAMLGSGPSLIDWTAYGGNVDPKSTGGTGDILLTTAGAVSGATYDITIHLRPKP
jgi:hypothetical protein